jgi:hypothetical protein
VALVRAHPLKPTVHAQLAVKSLICCMEILHCPSRLQQRAGRVDCMPRYHQRRRRKAARAPRHGRAAPAPFVHHTRISRCTRACRISAPPLNATCAHHVHTHQRCAVPVAIRCSDCVPSMHPKFRRHPARAHQEKRWRRDSSPLASKVQQCNERKGRAGGKQVVVLAPHQSVR